MQLLHLRIAHNTEQWEGGKNSIGLSTKLIFTQVKNPPSSNLLRLYNLVENTIDFDLNSQSNDSTR